MKDIYSFRSNGKNSETFLDPGLPRERVPTPVKEDANLMGVLDSAAFLASWGVKTT